MFHPPRYIFSQHISFIKITSKSFTRYPFVILFPSILYLSVLIFCYIHPLPISLFIARRFVLRDTCSGSVVVLHHSHMSFAFQPNWNGFITQNASHRYLFVILSPFVVHFAFPPLSLPQPLLNSTFRMLLKVTLHDVRLLLNTL